MIELKDDTLDFLEQLLIYTDAYFRYFVQNPYMFQLIFIEDLGIVPQELLKNDKKPSVGFLLRASIRKCASVGYISGEDIDILHGLIGSSIHGKLLFLIKGRDIKRLEDVVLSVRDEVEFLIKMKR